MSNSRSILKYPGGKSFAVKELVRYVPYNTKQICSPFFGGGSFEFFLERELGIKVFAYDNFDLLINFWQQVKDNPDEVCKYIPEKVDKDFIKSFQKSIYDISDKAKQAAYFYILSRCTFSGTITSGGLSPLNILKYNYSKAINNISSFKTSIEFQRLPFNESIPKHDCLIYADPPYLIGCSHIYGKHGDMHKEFEHFRLYKMLNDRGNFILSYNDSEEIKDLYHKHKFFFPQWNYGLSSNKGNSREILIVAEDVKTETLFSF